MNQPRQQKQPDGLDLGKLIISSVLSLFITGLIVTGMKGDKNMSKNLPRGYRNNNPLNIRLNAANDWLGKILPNTDGVFEQFTKMEYGYRAALKLIRNYINQGNTTIRQIITRWAPSNENNTSGYIQRVCDTLGAHDYDTVNSYSEKQMCDLVYAMALVENGNKPMPDMTQIHNGWRLL